MQKFILLAGGEPVATFGSFMEAVFGAGVRKLAPADGVRIVDYDERNAPEFGWEYAASVSEPGRTFWKDVEGELPSYVAPSAPPASVKVDGQFQLYVMGTGQELGRYATAKAAQIGADGFAVPGKFAITRLDAPEAYEKDEAAGWVRTL